MRAIRGIIVSKRPCNRPGWFPASISPPRAGSVEVMSRTKSVLISRGLES